MRTRDGRTFSFMSCGFDSFESESTVYEPGTGDDLMNPTIGDVEQGEI